MYQILHVFIIFSFLAWIALCKVFNNIHLSLSVTTKKPSFIREFQNHIRIPIRLCFYAVSAPLFAFITCVVLTIFKDFESANKTHCNVPNIFPSISASIGNFEPQSTIWKSAIYFHSPLRFYMVYLRWQFYRKIIRSELDIIVNLAVFLNIIENICLVGLTFWTSSLNYSYHEKCFKLFIGTSTFYMFFVCILLTKYRRRSAITNREKQSIKQKWRWFIINITMFGLAAFCFLRHNKYCEPYVYSIFGLSEYLVVFSNIAFHSTTVLDIEVDFIYLTNNGLTTGIN